MEEGFKTFFCFQIDKTYRFNIDLSSQEEKKYEFNWLDLVADEAEEKKKRAEEQVRHLKKIL
jgi:hypothetical protein